MGSLFEKNRFFLALLKGRVLKQSIPLLVFFTITHRCNGSCPYCFGAYENPGGKNAGFELNTEQIFCLIDQMAAAGTQRIGISGGEPLLRDDIGKIIDYAAQKKIHCGLNTNGYLIPQKISELAKLSNITISLDGDMFEHEQNRGKGTYEKTILAIERVKRQKIPLHVSMVLTRHNMNSIPFILERARKTGFLVQISPLYPCVLPEKNNNSLQLSDEQLRRILQQIITYKRKGYPVFYSQTTYSRILSWPDLQKDRYLGEKPRFPHAPCVMGKYACLLDANGDVYPCAQIQGLTPKNALSIGFKRAFQHINKHLCRACSWACYNELNLLAQLNPEVVMNTISNILFDKNHA